MHPDDELFILKVKELKKYYGSIKAVDGITFHVNHGEIYGLLGPNGAGKTTTIKSILGLVDIQGGKISVFNLDPTLNPVEVKAMVGYVSEEPHLYKSMSPEELFNFVASIRKVNEIEVSTRIQELIESFGLLKYYKKPIITLSKGNQQKVQLISALLHDPEFLILDEPLAGLDAKTSRIVRDLVKIKVENGGAVLLSTHVMEHASELCDRIGILNNGKMVAEGSLDELQEYARTAGDNLENIFLKLTDQDQDIKEKIDRLKKIYRQE
ncbi:MAG: ABC transporter ATP-binding protein [Promethearchaeota archaeon]